MRAVTGLARQIALPAEYAPERFPSFPALERTAVMGFNQPADLTVESGVTATKVGLFRQATYPAWADQTLPYGSYQCTWRATNVFGATTGTSNIEPEIVNWSTGPRPTSATTLVGASGTATATSPAYAIMGVDASTGPNPFIYMPANCSYTVILYTVANVNTSPIAATVTLQTWSSPGEISHSFVNISVAANVTGDACTVQTNPVGTWIRPSFVDFGTTGGATPLLQGPYFVTVFVHLSQTTTMQVGTSATLSPNLLFVPTAVVSYFMPLVNPVEFANSQLPWYSTRTTAVSLLATNVTQVLNKAGTVLGGRISPQVVSPWAVTKSYINSLHPAEKAWLPLETGVYTYCPPSTDLVDFWDYTLNTSAGAPNAPLMRLDNTSLVNIMYLTSSSTKESLAVTVTWHLEFRTSSALFQIALSGVQLESLHQAQLALAASGFFFENINHKAILAKITGAVSRVLPVAFKVATALSPGLRAAAVAYKAATKVAVPSASVSVPTTTAKASGILGPVRAKKVKVAGVGGKKKKGSGKKARK